LNLENKVHHKLLHKARKVVLKYAKGFRAEIGISTGNNLGELIDTIENPITIPYHKIPGVQQGKVAGHTHSRIVLGHLNGVPIACLQGRLHRYEGLPYECTQILFNALKWLGCDSVLIANASGSLRENIGPGAMVAINDHINFSFGSPLMGPNDEAIGPRFVSMTNTYDQQMRKDLHQSALKLGFELHEGVYLGVAGPMFETPAEIRAFRQLGADVVGMSTIPDVIFSRHCGLKVAVIAAIVNLAAGITGQELSHEETLSESEKVSHKITALIKTYIQSHYR
jgi:inosine/guanosine/xanthosine phosphorylase family protein